MNATQSDHAANINLGAMVYVDGRKKPYMVTDVLENNRWTVKTATCDALLDFNHGFVVWPSKNYCGARGEPRAIKVTGVIPATTVCEYNA